MDNRALQEEAALKYQQWREETIRKKYPLLAEPPMSYFGPRSGDGSGEPVAHVGAFDALFLSYEPLDIRAKRGDRKRGAIVEMGIAEEEGARVIPLRSSAVHGHTKHLKTNIIDFYPFYHALKEQYRKCGITFDTEDKSWHVW